MHHLPNIMTILRLSFIVLIALGLRWQHYLLCVNQQLVNRPRVRVTSDVLLLTVRLSLLHYVLSWRDQALVQGTQMELT